jgi:hypothetical protein
MSWIDAAKGASAPGERNYFNSGDYVVEVISLTKQSSLKPETKGQTLFIGRYRIVEVLADFPANADYAASNRVGEIVATVFNVDGKYADMERGKLNNLLTALIGPDWASMGEEALNGAVAAPGLTFAGQRIRATASRTNTSRSKKIAAVSFSALEAKPAEVGA